MQALMVIDQSMIDLVMGYDDQELSGSWGLDINW
jgi:hypothetical protein